MSLVTAQHGLSLGGLDLVLAGKPVVHTEGYTTDVSSNGTTWGNPEVVVAQIISALSDGDMVAQTHVGNRQVTVYVRISATASNILPLGEAALAAVVGKGVDLVWQPPDIAEPPTVFKVLHSRMDFVFDDFAELRRDRTYALTLTALPWGRSASKITTAAVTAVAPSVVDSGSATTNWSISRPAGATLSVASGAVRSSYNAATIQDGYYGTTMVRTATINVATNKYIGIDWKASLAVVHEPAFNGAFGNVEVRREPAPAAGYTRSWYRVSDSITSLSTLWFSIIHPAGSGTATLDIDQIVQANALPATGTTRQLTRTIDPGGSVPAEGDVLVQHASAGLGQTIVFSHPAGSGYSPSVSQWRTTSNTPTVDSTTVSGQRISLTTTPAQFEMPINAVPEGDYQLWARLRLATGAGALVGVFIGSGSAMGSVGFDAANQQVNVTLPGSAAWVIVPLARLTLPSRHLGPAGKVRLALLRATAHDIELDEAWLFAMDKGRLTVVDCGTGTPAVGTIHNRLRVTAPSLDAPFGQIEVGTAADWSDAFTPDAANVALDQTGHRFDSDGGSSIFTVTSGTTDASVSFEHYPRWHSNAGTP